MKFKLDWSKLETANNEIEGTAYYGGYCSLNGQEFPVGGTDCDTFLVSCVVNAVEKQLDRQLTADEDELVYGIIVDNWGMNVEFEI